jgi:hypothetical protein
MASPAQAQAGTRDKDAAKSAPRIFKKTSPSAMSGAVDRTLLIKRWGKCGAWETDRQGRTVSNWRKSALKGR